MSDKQRIYDTIFSLVEEELYQRLNSVNYRDSIYDGSKYSICGSSNLDLPINDIDDEEIILTGGGNKSINKKRSIKFIPGKFEVVKYSHNIPMNLAIKGSIERQKLFLKEHTV